MIKNELLNKFDEHLPSLQNEMGSVFYSGPSALRPGSLYLMGLNPGGSPEVNTVSIRKSIISSFERLPTRYSAYVDEFWLNNKFYSRHQKRVQLLAKICKQDIREIFSANSIFVRSKQAEDIEMRIDELSMACWPIHQFFLSIVRPKIIFCLGNGNEHSSFALLLKNAGITNSKILYVDKKNQDFRHGKFCETSIDLGKHDPLECTIIGIPHPSWYNITQELERFIKTAIS